MNDIPRLSTVIDVEGFFSKYKAEYSEHFISLFGDIDEKKVQSLDYLLSDIYGDMALCRKFAEMVVVGTETDSIVGRIVRDCDTRYYALWLTIKNAIEHGEIVDYDAPFKERRTYNETRENIADNANVSKASNKVYGYDSVDTAANESGVDSESTLNQTENGNIDSVEVINRSNNLLPTDVAQSQIDFSKNNLFLDFMFTDIIECVCLPIE